MPGSFADMAESKEHLQAVRDSAQRCRYVLIIEIMAASALLVYLINTYFSWVRHRFAYENLGGSGDDGSTWQLLRKRALESWVDSQNLSLPFIGEKINGFDALPLAAALMIVVATWHHLSVRREHMTLATFVVLDERVYRLFPLIASSFLFLTVGPDRPLANNGESIEAQGRKIKASLVDGLKNGSKTSPRSALTILNWYSVAVLALATASSLYVLQGWLYSPYWPAGSQPNATVAYSAIMWANFLLTAAATAVMGYLKIVSRRYSMGTQALLRALATKWVEGVQDLGSALGPSDSSNRESGNQTPESSPAPDPAPAS